MLMPPMGLWGELFQKQVHFSDVESDADSGMLETYYSFNERVEALSVLICFIAR